MDGKHCFSMCYGLPRLKIFCSLTEINRKVPKTLKNLLPHFAHQLGGFLAPKLGGIFQFFSQGDGILSIHALAGSGSGLILN